MNEHEETQINVSVDGEQQRGDLYSYPRNSDVRINQSDLAWELANFKRAIIKSEPLLQFGGIVALWVPVFTAGFKGFSIFSGTQILTTYVVATIFFTIKSLAPMFFRVAMIFRNSTFFKQKFSGWFYKNEVDPEKKAENILTKARDGN